MVFLLESLFSEIVVFRVVDSAKRQCFHTLVNDFLPIPAKADSVDVVDVASLSADFDLFISSAICCWLYPSIILRPLMTLAPLISSCFILPPPSFYGIYILIVAYQY